ncbi:MAG: FHIPEP family type III secretion protein, partial [Francisellaceae bacterium]
PGLLDLAFRSPCLAANEIKIHALSLHLSTDLMQFIGGKEGVLVTRITQFRKSYAKEMGFILPSVVLVEDKNLKTGSYRLFFADVEIAKATLETGAMLAINPGHTSQSFKGQKTQDPTYKLPAIWLDKSDEPKAKAAGFTVVDPLTVLLTHFSEKVRQSAALLLDRSQMDKMIGHLKKDHGALVDDLIPNVVSVSLLQKVLQKLISERVSIRNMPAIIETMAEHSTQALDEIVEAVRIRLGGAICQKLMAEDDMLHVMTLAPALEARLNRLMAANDITSLNIDPKTSEQLLRSLASQMEKMLTQNKQPVLMTGRKLRGAIKWLSERSLPQLSVISVNEIPSYVEIKPVAHVDIKVINYA